MILTSITSYSKYKYVLWAKWCSIILGYHPTCLLYSWPHIVTLWATIVTHLWAKMAENGSEQVFDNAYLQNPYSTHKSFPWATEWCSIILWYHPRCLLHSWPHIITLWAILATHLKAKMAKNGWKQIFDDTHFHNLLFYTQVWSMGHSKCLNDFDLFLPGAREKFLKRFPGWLFEKNSIREGWLP